MRLWLMTMVGPPLWAMTMFPTGAVLLAIIGAGNLTNRRGSVQTGDHGASRSIAQVLSRRV
jgi:hypothetical protein